MYCVMASAEVDAGFRPGTFVRVVGLQRTEFNNHVGVVLLRIATPGRVAVRLHGVFWAADDKHPTSRRNVIALRPQNLRQITQPSKRSKKVPCLDCLPMATMAALLGPRGWNLPDIAASQACDFLQVKRPSQVQVEVSKCSSTRGDFPLSCVISEDDSKWWISAAGSMPNGHGNEYLEFSFGAVPHRVEIVAVKIPPLPMGPLSVRHFHLQALPLGADAKEPAVWESSTAVALALLPDDSFATSAEISTEGGSNGMEAGFAPGHRFTTLDVAGLQEFAVVPPLETTTVRLVCTEAAAAGPGVNFPIDCVGLFRVCFA